MASNENIIFSMVTILLVFLPTLSSSQEYEIKEFNVVTKVQMRYAITNVQTVMKNKNNKSSEIIFDMYIPREAFVSKFSMLIKNKTYSAKVQTTKNATDIYNESDTTTGLLENENITDLFSGLQYVSVLNKCILKNWTILTLHFLGIIRI